MALLLDDLFRAVIVQKVVLHGSTRLNGDTAAASFG